MSFKEKRFKVEVGYHGVHRIRDNVARKTYTFHHTHIHDLEVWVDLLNNMIDTEENFQ